MQEQKALQINLEKHLSGNKDLKQVIKKLDTELKREKSQVNVLK